MKQRKKCNWGAIAVPVIGGVFNLIGGYSSARSARKLAERQAEQQRQLQIEQNNINRQNNMANILNNYNNVQEYNANNNTHFDFSNIQSNPNPERAFPHTPTNVNNNKVKVVIDNNVAHPIYMKISSIKFNCFYRCTALPILKP